MRTIHDTRTTQPKTIDSGELTRALLAAIAVIALAGLVLAAIVLMTARPATSVDASAASTGDVRDGWSSYLGAAARPAAQPVVDGWSSYLLVPEVDPATVVDGWSSYLLEPEVDPATVVDGWMARYGKND